ncbi:MAG: 50S ribosomal protein L13 [Candidatus Micrarchaeota archaeon]|nr:50S ribosomal protein L13 [Candidatus Micrarchaeota archaeon]
MVVIDADGAVIGRLGARISKLLLAGNQVEVINAEKSVMLGSLPAAKERFLSRRHQKNKRNPEESPHWPRSPHLLLRRMIRGMLPWSSQRGRDAYHRLKVTAGSPPNMGKPTKIKEASSESKHGFFTLEEFCKEVGYHGKSTHGS